MIDATTISYIAAVTSDWESVLSRVCREKHGFGVTEWRILHTLARGTAQTQSDIVHESGMDKAAVSRTIRVLMESKILVEARDPDDRRRVQILITDHGRAALQRAEDDIQFAANLYLAALSDDEKATLGALVTKVFEAKNGKR